MRAPGPAGGAVGDGYPRTACAPSNPRRAHTMTSTPAERVAAPVREIGGFFAMSLDTLV
ncbi:hypothetical protein [Mycobacterium sp.]|uniref:hypothetical protein n=1 Tax=Mycobacterium sp. TaxID=1785 RepID=UPI002C073CD7|nr:hypothetical protein [Mycobacterium sp.]HXB84721.1 hypothetical protein [Mycobacterium sp.]